ncbi:MAG TPA: nitrate ABC transporter permease, partial [Thermodesulfobacteriota bacterium]|nr:nitrate ABC transporter permease [Thermodesulfobacteriota bacterium]
AQPAAAAALLLLVWTLLSRTASPDLPSPWQVWQEGKPYVLDPFFKEGEAHQGLGRLAAYSLARVGKGFLIAILIATPLGFVLGLSPRLRRAVDPLIQGLRPVSPLAWLPLGLVLFQRSEPAALFAIALCAMWPTVLNTAAGVQRIDPDYLNVGRVLGLSRTERLVAIVIPATLPQLFTGYRLSLGIAWLVIVAAEMLTGAPGLGGFLWQAYNSLLYSHMILGIAAIGLTGLVLDRLMGLVEARVRGAGW